ncbi:MAG: hypothetical protein LIP11_10400 [Clostridiales bacterium]|nr:hypothetical protein [Clostridiales bacterium]
MVIPPASGFISKWYLAQGALEANVGVFGWAGPAALLLSALLTAGYLLSIVTNGFFPKVKSKAHVAIAAENTTLSESSAGETPTEMPGCQESDPLAGVTEAPLGMLIPLAIFAALSILLGVFPNPLIQFVSRIAAAVM